MVSFVVCPKSIPLINSGTYFGSFVFHFLRKNQIKAVVPNECWMSFKFRVRKKFSERFSGTNVTTKTEEYLAKVRGWLRPESPLLDKFGRDIMPTADFDDQILIDKTRHLVDRKWQIINYFIAQKKDEFEDAKITPKSIEEFFPFCLSKPKDSNARIIAEDFASSYSKEDW